ncbi:MAG: hypothetical protein ABIR05_01110 [Luteimonas sp.]
MRLPLILCTGVFALALAACGEETVDVPEATDAAAVPADAAGAATAPAPASTQPIDVVQIGANEVQVGTSVDATQAATGAKAVYALGDTVHASIDTRAHPGAMATVYWTDNNGMSQKIEKKAMTGDHVAFAFSRADGMKPGKYSVGIDVDNVPVGLADFKVQ